LPLMEIADGLHFPDGESVAARLALLDSSDIQRW